MDKMIQELRKLPLYVEAIMFGGLTVFGSIPEIVTHNKKNEVVHDIDVLIAKLNEIKTSVVELEIK